MRCLDGIRFHELCRKEEQKQCAKKSTCKVSRIIQTQVTSNVSRLAKAKNKKKSCSEMNLKIAARFSHKLSISHI